MPESRPASVSVRELTKRYGPVEAVRGVSFEVASGEIFGLLGPNGAGKTTTLECLLGLRRPDSGTIALDGLDAVARPELAKERVGAQLQAATLQDKITPRQALKFFASFYREPATVDGLIERFALLDKVDAPFDSLSGGQRQRLFLALAFVNNPQIVVLDEPTAGLDEASEQQVLSAVRDLARTERRAVILVAHRPAALALADRVVRLDWRADADDADAGPSSPAETSGAVAGPVPVDAVA